MIRYIERAHAIEAHALADAGVGNICARLLALRGVETPEQADSFMNPSLDQLNDPFALSGVACAVEILRCAIDGGKSILIYGDYDVDGVCACALLEEALVRNGARASHYIPSRHGEGYGLNIPALEKLRSECDIIVTVDCGITAVEEAKWAKDNGLTMIITDHHEPPARLPDCAAIIDPLIDAPNAVSPCGTGVAFKLVQALFGLSEAARSLDIAALATIADLVPLLGENRVFAAAGLDALRKTRRPGLAALIEAIGLTEQPLSAGQIGYQIAPRINAGGRIASADRNVELLRTEDIARAKALAEELNRENEVRQRIQREIFEQADLAARRDTDFLRERVMTPVGDGWNAGVIGLAASELVEKYRIPAIVFSREEAPGGAVCVGSARSIPGVHIQRAMTVCSDLFIRFGGHSQAAGCTILSDNIPELRERLNAAIIAQSEPSAFIPTERYDAEIRLSDITLPMLDTLVKLEPHGIGNPAPTFRIRGARVLSSKAVGKTQAHIKMRLGQNGDSIDAIAFGQADQIGRMPELIDTLARGSINEWQGRRAAQCQIIKMAPDDALSAFERGCERERSRFEEALADLLINADEESGGAHPLPRSAMRSQVSGWLRASHQGTLLLCDALGAAADTASWLRSAGLSDRLDFLFGAPDDPRAFNTLAALAHISELSAPSYAGRGSAAGDARSAPVRFDRVVFLDGIPRSNDIAALRKANPNAGFWFDEEAADETREASRHLAPSDEQLRRLYRALRARVLWRERESLAQASGLCAASVKIGLEIFKELDLLEWNAEPFEAALRPAKKRSLADSELYLRARGIGREPNSECAPPCTKRVMG
ncbi:MAG: single-stranded-DNA-specific exonuclease RecJ [Oscillospiraceae bacterium]|nr:single-stranded-DNA-specific exonuclease RecJ [Oscillospiraceae bacterium]